MSKRLFAFRMKIFLSFRWFVPNAGQASGGVSAGMEMQNRGENSGAQLKRVNQEYPGHFAHVANKSGVGRVVN